MNKPKSLVLVLAVLFFAVLYSCNTTEPPTPPPVTPVAPKTLKLSLVETSCTEAYIKVEALSDTILPATVNLKKNNILLFSFTLAGQDTVIADTTLQVNTSYSYQAVRVENGTEGEDKSDTLTVKTLNTTSNNFTWQTYTFGEHSSSVLNDVAIIDENNIWAVGEIYMNDSTGQPDPHAYNAVHWDGSKWELKRITTNFKGNLITVPLEGIFAFSANDIWMVGSLPIHGDGTNWTMYDVRTSVDPNLSLSRCWGSDTNNMYFVGRNGSIAHYSNGYWKKIESGTSIGIMDIWGEQNSAGEIKIYAVGSGFRDNISERQVYQINNSTAVKVSNSGLPIALTGIWFKGDHHFFICGDGLYTTNSISAGWTGGYNGIPAIYEEKIIGTDLNNIFVAGDFGLVLHFNGMSWHSFLNNGLPKNNGVLLGADAKGNLVVFAGETGNEAEIIVGKY